jgi:hypothetical protein
MDTTFAEKRAYPRIRKELKIDVPGDISARLVDLSEGGAGLSSEETVKSDKIAITIHFPASKTELKAKANLVWKRDLAAGGSSYGLEFTGLNSNQKAVLRKEIIEAQIGDLLNKIQSEEVKRDVSKFFMKDMLDYTNRIIELESGMRDKLDDSGETEKEFTRLNNEILLKGYCLEELVENKGISSKSRENFRELLGAWLYKSPVLKRAFDKSPGYPDDYMMLESIYNNKPISDRGIGYYVDKYFLSNPYAVAVRNRKNKMRELLEKEIKSSEKEAIKILSIACGSCREIRELLLSLKKIKRIDFSCLDWDKEALKFSHDAICSGMTKGSSFKFINEDVMTLIREEGARKSFDKQDIIYSMSIMDHLPDRLFKKLTAVLYGFLENSGKLIFAHNNSEKTFPPLPPSWFCNWKYVPRSKDYVYKLIHDCGLPGLSLKMDSDDFDYVHYYTVTRNGA